jgi:hypothetical protein
MPERNQQTKGKRTSRLVLIAAAASVVIWCSACGGEKENMPGTQPNAPASAPPPVKPSITATRAAAKAITASKSNPDGEPKFAIDGDVTTAWSAGDVGPPQWIQLDLGEPTTISEVLLNVGQTPDGPTTHEVYGGPAPDNLKLLGTLNGNTQDGQWLELKAKANDVRYVKVVTTKTPSWIAWREIEVYK